MRNLGLLIIVLFLTNILSAYAIYEPPSDQEKLLFNQLLTQFQKSDVPKKDVTDVVMTFQKPLIVSFPCNSNDTNNFVVTVITTRLAKFDQNLVHQDLVTGGTYTWHCKITTEAGKVTVQCDNELRLNSQILSNDSDVGSKIHQVENLVILYHELLHGQLMIDAINSSPTWKHEVCNKMPQEIMNYSYADPNHKVINPLQSQFASELISEEGGKMITQVINPNQTINGTFTTKVLDLLDYPQFHKGVEVTLRGANIGDTKFNSSGINLFVTGYLVNKNESGTMWFYVFNKQVENKTTNNLNPIWAKRVAGLWANGHANNSDFHNVIQYLIQQDFVVTNGERVEGNQVPQWLKKTANWWYEGEIDNTTFVNSIEYLISNKIIS